MQAPTRIEVPTCVGCGAMNRPGSCETGCSEHRLDLVRADAYDALLARAAAVRARGDDLAAAAERIAAVEPVDGDWEAAYRSAQDLARSGLRRHCKVEPLRDAEFDQPAEPAIT